MPERRRGSSASGARAGSRLYNRRIARERTQPPAPSTRFVGRREEIDAVAGHLAGGERLVSIVGPGGIGKTRLAVRVVARLPGDAVFCDLTEARDLAGALATVARTVGAAEPDADAIGLRLAELGPAVLVLDSCEQAAAAVAAAIADWLELAPDIQIVTTTRERLRLGAEVVVELGPLDPDDSVALFLDRARRIVSDYAEGEEEVAAHIAHRLDGMPLALELAAARAGVLGPAQLLDRLERRFELLCAGTRAVPRHQTLRATLDWSWELLSEAERDALAQLSVFRGGFSLDAAEEVVELYPEPDVLEVVQSLRDKSLLRSETTATGESRLGMYPTIREYAAEKLAERGDVGVAAAARHAAYFGARADVVAEDLPALDAEADNLAAAVDRAMASPNERDALDAGVRALCALAPLRLARGPIPAYAARLDRALQAAPLRTLDVGLQARAFLARGHAREVLGERQGCVKDYEHALTLAGEAGDQRLQDRLLLRLGVVAVTEGRFDAAREHYELAYLLAQHLDDRVVEARALTNLGVAASESDRLSEARDYFERARAIYLQLGDRRREEVARGNLANILLDEGKPEEARVLLEGVSSALADIGDRRTAAIFGVVVATIDHVEGDLAAARRGYNSALQAVHEVGDRAVEGIVLGYLGALAADRGAVATAREHLAAASELLAGAGDASALDALGLHEGHVELARGDAAAARARADAVPRHPAQKVRAALRILRAAIGRKATPEPRTVDVLEVGPDAAWFRTPEGERVSLGRRKTLRRVLSALAATHGQGLDTPGVFAAGWPGERISGDAAANRVRVAIATLRKMGLRPYLLTGPDGYTLDPDIEVEVRAAE